jgi:cold shock CspA family protein
MRPVDRHRWVNAAGELTEHHEVSWNVGIDWRHEKERERERVAWRERKAWPTPPQAAPAWVEGTIRQFYPEKGHGFVRLADGSARDNVFFHRSAIEGATDADLVLGRSVRFAVGADDRREGKPIVTRLVLAEEAVSGSDARPAHHRRSPILGSSQEPDTSP